MIERKNLFSIPFYDKTSYNGSYCGMRFRIEKHTQEDETVLLATYWPGPYCFSATDPELMSRQTFPYSPEGIDAVCEWLNQSYEADADTFLSVHI